ncbi:Hpt domain-containing protein [Marinifilum sp. JC120]|nr:Hpt domain-containing protein [Marinifilum sp. JC120]
MDVKIVERIDADLQGLVSGFIKITYNEIKDLEDALNAGDMDVVARIGHNLKGSALNYGFSQLGAIGLRIETCAALNKPDEVQVELEVLKDYVERVEVEFV